MSATPKPLRPSRTLIEHLDDLRQKYSKLEAENAELRDQAKFKPLPEWRQLPCDGIPPGPFSEKEEDAATWYAMIRTRYGQPTGPTVEQLVEFVLRWWVHSIEIDEPSHAARNALRKRASEVIAAGWRDEEPDALSLLLDPPDGYQWIKRIDTPSGTWSVDPGELHEWVRNIANAVKELRKERSHE